MKFVPWYRAWYAGTRSYGANHSQDQDSLLSVPRVKSLKRNLKLFESDAILREELPGRTWPRYLAILHCYHRRSFSRCWVTVVRMTTRLQSAITSIDGMTADFAKSPWEVLQKTSFQYNVNEVTHVNCIVYDTSKPPATVEE